MWSHIPTSIGNNIMNFFRAAKDTMPSSLLFERTHQYTKAPPPMTYDLWPHLWGLQSGTRQKKAYWWKYYSSCCPENPQPSSNTPKDEFYTQSPPPPPPPRTYTPIYQGTSTYDLSPMGAAVRHTTKKSILMEILFLLLSRKSETIFKHPKGWIIFTICVGSYISENACIFCGEYIT